MTTPEHRPLREIRKGKSPTKDDVFVSHAEMFRSEKERYQSNHPYVMPDYTEEYKAHLQKKGELLQVQNDTAPPPPKPSANRGGMTDLMNLVQEPPPEEDSEDILEDIRKDFISPYEKESVSTVMMPASQLLEEARLAQEEDEAEPYEFQSVEPREASRLYSTLEKYCKDIVKEWQDHKHEYNNKEVSLRFENAVISKLNSIAAQAIMLPQKSDSFIRNWIQQNIFRIVDEFFSFFSKVFASAYSGDMSAARIRNWIQELLFGRLNDLFKQLQWFSIEMLLPLQSEFNHQEQIMLNKQNSGAEFRNYIISIENAGLFSADESKRIRKARVIVGS